MRSARCCASRAKRCGSSEPASRPLLRLGAELDQHGRFALDLALELARDRLGDAANELARGVARMDLEFLEVHRERLERFHGHGVEVVAREMERELDLGADGRLSSVETQRARNR